MCYGSDDDVGSTFSQGDLAKALERAVTFSVSLEGKIIEIIFLSLWSTSLNLYSKRPSLIRYA